MGLLDWLNEGIGSDSGGPPLPNPTPAPPDSSYAEPRKISTLAVKGDPMSMPFGPSPSGFDLPPSPPSPQVPMPMARPPGADASPSFSARPLTRAYNADGSPALPPAAAPTSGTGMPPGPPLSLMPPNAAPSDFRQNGVGPLGRVLGLDANRAREVSGSLASGLKSVGDNWNKPGLAALSGSAGSALEGGNTASDKTEDKQLKYLQQAIVEAKAGNENALNIARTKLALAQAKTAEEGDPEKTALTVARTRESTARARKLEEGGGTKNSVVNSPEQLYLRAIGATNSDGKLSLLKNTYIQASKDGQQDTPAAKAAKAAYEKAYDETRDGHLKTLGVDPKIAGKIGKQAGFSADNPIPSAGLTKEKFDQLPVGSYFLNPKDGRLLIKQPPAGANPPPAASSPTPAPAAASPDDDE